MQYQYKVHDKKICYDGFFRFYEYTVSYESFAGGFIENVTRECSKKSDIVVIVAHDPKLDQFILVEQFRVGMVARGEHPWIYEVIAGFMDVDGESPELTAKRELLEETGCKAINIKQVMSYYGSPGGSGSKTYVFVATVDINTKKEITGIRAEGEDILVHAVSRAELLELLETPKLQNSTSIIAFGAFFKHEKLAANNLGS